jgi:hypothetical protein
MQATKRTVDKILKTHIKFTTNVEKKPTHTTAERLSSSWRKYVDLQFVSYSLH